MLLQMPIIRSGKHIMLNGPAKASIPATPGFTLSFYLFGVMYKIVNFDYANVDREMLSAPLYKSIMSTNGNRYLTVLYAIFERAAEAHVKVKLINPKSDSAFDLYGVIAARTTAIKNTAYSSILFFKDEDEPGEKIKVRHGNEIMIPLSRPFIAVPLEFELILDISLHSNDQGMIVEDTVTFTAKEGVMGSKSHPMKCSKGEIEVEVSWRYKRF